MRFSLRLTAPVGSVETVGETGRGGRSAREDIEIVSILVEEFRRAFGTVPVGEGNAEITRQFVGDNLSGIAVLPRDHPNINKRGELVDQWGTPYRFHPQSNFLLSLRSAGLDRTMWTSDDVLSEECVTLSDGEAQ